MALPDNVIWEPGFSRHASEGGFLVETPKVREVRESRNFINELRIAVRDFVAEVFLGR